MGHNHANHGHGHGHDHGHAPASFGRAFAIGISLNIGFVIAEVIAGLAADSTALLADAGHNLSDVLGLIIAWGGATLARRPPTRRFTYGYRGSTILAALFNAMLLMVAIGAIIVEAVQRFGTPEPVNGQTVMIVAIGGIMINGFTAWLFARGSKDDINVRGAYLHMAADAAVSAGVVISGALIMVTGQTWIDPITSLIIVAVIFWSTWGLFRQAVKLSLNGVPDNIDLSEVERVLTAEPGVAGVHHLHVWAMSTSETALTAHVEVAPGHDSHSLIRAISAKLEERFGIAHSTIQVEQVSACPAPATSCA